MAITEYRYPIEETDYPGKVIFTPVVEPSVEASLVRRAVDDAAEGNEGLNGDAGENQRKTGNVPKVELGNTSCILYFPGSLNINDGVTYNNVDLGTLGGAAEAAINSGSSALSGVLGAAGGEISSFIESFKSGAATDTSKLAANKVASAFANDGVASAVKSQTRVTTNPNTRALFESVPLREFSFSFKMIPQSAREAEEIKNIIRFFRSELYPEEIKTGQNADFNFSIGYKFPNRFDIQFLYKGKEVATKIYYSYLTSFNATYNSSGMGMHSDGNFTEVDISMEFLESRALSKFDIVSDPNAPEKEFGY